MVKLLFFLLFVGIVLNGSAQQKEDSLKSITPFEVLVKAFEQNKRLQEVPIAISIVGKNELNRFNNTNLLPALNALPGVKMEERSPGSYRLNIRGSSLRSPFGVRNVKIYYNGIPLTDPGGNTYLNQLGFYNVETIEVIKGPGSSLYGAGTGGVMLLESQATNKMPGIKLDQTFGSFQLSNTNINISTGNDEAFSSINYQHQTSDGYRNHTNMKRQVFSWDANIKLKNNELTGHLLYGNLYYQTPGALNLAEYTANPKSARPRVGTAPGSQENKAAIYLKTFLAGASYKQVFNDYWQNTTSMYGAYAEQKNPAIRNYGRNAEPHFGGRSVIQYQSKQVNRSAVTWHLGAEYQKANNTVQVFNNKSGNPDSLVTNDEINNSQFFLFTQLSWQFNNWVFTGGLSINDIRVNLTRTTNRPVTFFNRNYNNELAPRIAVLNKVTSNLSVYASFSKGFSPPTVSELSPSGSAINNNLNAEKGNNYELGLRGTAGYGRLSYDVNAFYYQLQNAIVQRRDALGGDFFMNAGSTKQQGLETFVSYRLATNSRHITSASKIWLTHNWYRFRYNNFKQITSDFSGNSLPSVAPQSLTAGLDLYATKGMYINITYNYTDAIPLNDANTAYAHSYNLMSARAGYKHAFKKFNLEFFTGVENLFDVKYNLGNDINGFGGRYYNAAAGRNYFAGISLQQLWK